MNRILIGATAFGVAASVLILAAIVLGSDPARSARSPWGDGVLPDGVGVFTESYPGIRRLDPALLSALRRAATDAEDSGVSFTVNSGWRSRAYQQRLLDEAVRKYGSARAAARWVATPENSPHVSGDAVDLGPAAATTWLARHGAGYGLCRIYRNEPWHFELRPDAPRVGCPDRYADPTRDARLRMANER